MRRLSGPKAIYRGKDRHRVHRITLTPLGNALLDQQRSAAAAELGCVPSEADYIEYLLRCREAPDVQEDST